MKYIRFKRKIIKMLKIKNFIIIKNKLIQLIRFINY